MASPGRPWRGGSAGPVFDLRVVDGGGDQLEDDGGAGFLTSGQRAAYGRYDGPPTVAELDQFFVLDDEDRRLIAGRRRDSSRLGFALQLTTLRFLGTFLDDPADVPQVVVDDLAAQLGIGDPSCVKSYGERENTRLEHRRQICRETGWRDYADGAPELALWMDRRTWNTGESSRALFDGATGWLRQHRVLLPGVTTLTEDVAKARRAAEERLWARLAEQLNDDRAAALVGLLDVSADSKKSALELLRRGPVDRTAKAFVAALDRVAAVERIGVAGADLGMVPQRRVRELARDGMVRNATALRRRRPHDKRLATLLAAVVYLRAKATDDALELFDVIMANELLARGRTGLHRREGASLPAAEP